MRNDCTELSIKGKGKKTSFDEVVYEIAGDIGLEVADLLSKKGELSDDEIAEVLGIRVNIVRKVLYKLYENNLASYRRVRNPETGWFTFYWKLSPERLYDHLRRRKLSILRILEERLKYEKENLFYVCENSCVRLTFDEAMENSFHCPECGGLLQYYDNSKVIRVLEKRIKALKKELGV
ncbi:MAG: transcription factor E [Candidatus Asgardarchaeia archaeon]